MVLLNTLLRLTLNDELKKNLFEGDDLLMSHQSTIFLIERWMDLKEKSMEDEWSLQKKFEHLAFNKYTAKILKLIVESSPLPNHQSEKYWGLQYLETSTYFYFLLLKL